MLQSLFLACLGGAIGSGLRLVITTVVSVRVGTGFPFATMAINIAGCFCLGVVAEAIRDRGPAATAVQAFVAVGILGGFTTFSAFSYDALRLFEHGRVLMSLLYVCGSVLIGIVAAAAGVALVRLFANVVS